MSSPHYLTLGQAAKLSEVAKSTITRAINKGQLSAAQRIGNSYRINPAELQRWRWTRVVARPQATVKAQQLDSDTQQRATLGGALSMHVPNAKLEAELEALKRTHDQTLASNAEMKGLTDRMIADKDREVERLYTLAITDQRQRKGFWQRLFGGMDSSAA